MQSRKDQLLIVKACHSEPTSGHFGMTKTWKKITERFYWKGMVSDVHKLADIAIMLHYVLAEFWIITDQELPHLSANESQDGPREAIAPTSCQVTLVPHRNGLCLSHITII